MSACAFGCLALQMGMPFVVTYPYNIILLVNDRDDVILRCDIHTTPLVRFGDSLPILKCVLNAHLVRVCLFWRKFLEENFTILEH